MQPITTSVYTFGKGTSLSLSTVASRYRAHGGDMLSRGGNEQLKVVGCARRRDALGNQDDTARIVLEHSDDVILRPLG